MAALDMIYPEHSDKIMMSQNESGKFESAFLSVEVQPTNSIMLKDLAGATLGIWVAHGEGRFSLPKGEAAYDIPLRYASSSYPANPNGADFNAAAVVSANGRHLAMMPHLERAILPWQWPYYISYEERKRHQVSPWILAFLSAREWVSKMTLYT